MMIERQRNEEDAVDKIVLRIFLHDVTFIFFGRLE